MGHKYIKAVEKAILLAETNFHKIQSLPPEILSISGMSSEKVKIFLNSLMYLLDRVAYLEIGLLKGSTFISALYGNEFKVSRALGIDNWSEFDKAYDEFKSNFDKHLKPIPSINIINADCFQIQLPDSKFNVYFYDGGHGQEEQKKAFTYFNPSLEDVFIAIVDDWNWESTRLGTFEAFKELKYDVIKQWELPANGNGDAYQWWNGLYVAVIQKEK